MLLMDKMVAFFPRRLLFSQQAAQLFLHGSKKLDVSEDPGVNLYPPQAADLFGQSHGGHPHGNGALFASAMSSQADFLSALGKGPRFKWQDFFWKIRSFIFIYILGNVDFFTKHFGVGAAAGASASAPSASSVSPLRPTPLSAASLGPSAAAPPLSLAAGPMHPSDYSAWLCRPVAGYLPLPSNLLAARLAGEINSPLYVIKKIRFRVFFTIFYLRLAARSH